jgi:hypothetical protein
MTDSRKSEFLALYDRALAGAQKAAAKCQERDRARFRDRSLEALVKTSLSQRLSTLVARRCYQMADWTEKEIAAWLKLKGWRESELYELFQLTQRKFERAANRPLAQSGKLILGPIPDHPAKFRAKMRRLRRQEGE